MDTTSLYQNICQGSTYNFFGSNLGNAGTYYHTLTSSLNCDSVVKLNLTVNNVDTLFFTQTICSGDSIVFNGQYISQAGNHYAYYTNSLGCDSIHELYLQLHPLPQTPVITYSSDTLFSGINFGNQWYLNGNPVSGATDSVYVYTQNGNYFVIVTDSNACISDTSNVLVVYWVEIQSPISGHFTVFPNPVRKILIIQNTQNNNEAFYHLSDQFGRVLKKGEFTNSIKLDISYLPKASYYLNITGWQNKLETFVIIKN